MLFRRCPAVLQPIAAFTSRPYCPPSHCTRQARGAAGQFQGQSLAQISIKNTSRPKGARCLDASACMGGVFFLDEFAIRQWDDPNYSGTRIQGDKQQFIDEIHRQHSQGAELVLGYAPFCKHVFVRNFVAAKLGALQITDQNRHLLQCGYSRRRPDELPVLTRWFLADSVEGPEAEYLDIILYSREQLVKEYEAMPSKGSGDALPKAPWGIISIKAQDEDHETPMQVYALTAIVAVQPITIMRNSLGPDEGGSGVPLDRQKYEESAAFWDQRAAILSGSTPTGE